MKNYSYTINARIFPAFICTLPILIFYYFFLAQYLSDFINVIGKIKLVQDVSFSTVIIYLLAQVDRSISKDFFERRYFIDELDMPTTVFLTHLNNQYSQSYKNKIYQKIWKDFQIRLSTRDQEKKNVIRSKKQITEAVSLIRKKVGNGTLLLQHNIEYGFIRNLIGGSVIATIVSLFNIYFFTQINQNQIAFYASAFCLMAFLIPIVLSKKLMQNYGQHYARILIQEYMSL